jgi:hypothetical protein
MANSIIPVGGSDDDGFASVPTTGRGAIRGSPITYNAQDGNYWRDRVDVVNGETYAVLAYRRGWQYWPLDGSAPQLLLDEPGAAHPDRSAFGNQDKSEWRDGPDGPSDPYVDVWTLILANPQTGAESTFITPTAGGSMAVEILVDGIRKKRRRKPDAYRSSGSRIRRSGRGTASRTARTSRSSTGSSPAAPVSLRQRPSRRGRRLPPSRRRQRLPLRRSRAGRRRSRRASRS